MSRARVYGGNGRFGDVKGDAKETEDGVDPVGPECDTREGPADPSAIVSVLGASPVEGDRRVGGRREGNRGVREATARQEGAIRGQGRPARTSRGAEARGRREDEGVVLEAAKDIHKSLEEED